MSNSLRLAMAQLNSTVGDLQGNASRILNFARKAAQAGARILLTPELSLCGYIPEDLLFRDDFHEGQMEALQTLIQGSTELPNLTLIVGAAIREGGALYNAACLITDGHCRYYFKQARPNHSVFDEKRYFVGGQQGAPIQSIEHGGRRHTFSLLVCEDIWDQRIVERFNREASAVDTLLSMNASPYYIGKHETRLQAVRSLQAQRPRHVFYCNAAGGQDEVIFDGQSFYADEQGRCVNVLNSFTEGLALFELHDGGWSLLPEVSFPQDLCAHTHDCLESEIWAGLVMGTRDYFHKNGFQRAVLGLSGGIDSAVVLAIAVEALGPENVTAVMMPSRFTADISVEDAGVLAQRLAVHFHEIAIEPLQQQFLQALAPVFGDRPADTTEENLQARIRGVLLMAIANKFGALVLPTGNKSEMAAGYCTLYGDMVGAYAMLKDIPKTMVYRLARWCNRQQEVIPAQIITRPPSAELAEDQKDEDSLPPYDVLDGIMKLLVEENASVQAIAEQGYNKEDVQRVASLLRVNEYKRRQGAPGPKITPVAFGRERRYPITNGFKF